MAYTSSQELTDHLFQISVSFPSWANAPHFFLSHWSWCQEKQIECDWLGMKVGSQEENTKTKLGAIVERRGRWPAPQRGEVEI